MYKPPFLARPTGVKSPNLTAVSHAAGSTPRHAKTQVSSSPCLEKQRPNYPACAQASTHGTCRLNWDILGIWCPQNSVQLVRANNSNFTRVYGRYIYSYYSSWGLWKPTNSWAPPCGSMCYFDRLLKRKNVGSIGSKGMSWELDMEHWDSTLSKEDAH